MKLAKEFSTCPIDRSLICGMWMSEEIERTYRTESYKKYYLWSKDLEVCLGIDTRQWHLQTPMKTKEI